MRRNFAIGLILLIVCLIWIVIGRYNPPTTLEQATRASEADAGFNRTFTAVDFKDTPFDQAIESLRTQTKANIIVRWRTLEAAGIERRRRSISG